MDIKKIEGLKGYKVYSKFVKGIFMDGTEFEHSAYDPFPSGHSIEDKAVKMAMRASVLKLNDDKLSDELIFDRLGDTGYMASDVKRLYWGKDEPRDNMLLIDITSGVDLKKSDIFEYDGETYLVFKDVDWVKNLGVKFAYCTKVIQPTLDPLPLKAEKEVKDKEVS